MDGVWFGGGIGRSCLLRDWLGVLSRAFCGCEILFAGLRHAPPVSRMRLSPDLVLVVAAIEIFAMQSPCRLRGGRGENGDGSRWVRESDARGSGRSTT